MTLWLGSHIGGAGLAVVLNESVEEWPSVVVMDELKGFYSGRSVQRSDGRVC